MTLARDTAFCLSEDRVDCEVGLRLAVLSLREHFPEAGIFVYRHGATEDFTTWMRAFERVTLIPERPPGAIEWNCKPQAMQPILEAGYRQVIWADSDIIATKHGRGAFTGLPDDAVLVTQEPTSARFQGTRVRTVGWNLPIGREFPFTLNSCIVRVTKAHAALLERWTELLLRPEYLTAQALRLEERPLHMMGDQDILNALLGSSDFAHVPVRVLGSGTEIVHTGGALGYSLGQRLQGLAGAKPGFLHATAGKPWLWLGGDPYWSRPNFAGWQRRLLQETSPYLAEARRYRDRLGLDTSWMDKRSGLGTLLRVLGFGHFALRGLPITLVATLASEGQRFVSEVREQLSSTSDRSQRR